MKLNIFFKIAVVFILFPILSNAQAFSWAQTFISSSGEAGFTSMVCDANNNLYTIGGFKGTVDFDAGPNTYNLTNTGSYPDLCLLKEDAAGNFLWVKQFPTLAPNSGWSGSTSVALDKMGNIYIFGSFMDSVDCNPDPLVTYSIKTNGSFHTFILKLDSVGNFIWAKHYGGDQPTGTNAVFGSAKLALNAKHIYITSTISGTIDADPGLGVYSMTSTVPNAADFIIEKLDSAGNFIWAKQITGNNSKGGQMTLDSLEYIYISGMFKGTADFDPGLGVVNLTSGTGGTSPLAPSDIFVAKYDSAGNFVWVKQIGNPGNNDVGQDIVVDRWNNIAVSGYFEGTVDFDPGPGVYNLTSNSSRNIFTLKL
ncbi:MAG: hypothetical protein JST52_12465, partial [Bacteroidetes bacterium]|nr:hypothetical protein [Bacteroidota bacterium]